MLSPGGWILVPKCPLMALHVPQILEKRKTPSCTGHWISSSMKSPFFAYESHFAPKSRTQGSVYLTSPPKEGSRHQRPVPGNLGSVWFHLSEHRTSMPACLIQLGASWIPRLTHQIRELGSHDLGLLPASQGLKFLEADHLPKTPSQVNASSKGVLYTLDIWSALLTSHNST